MRAACAGRTLGTGPVWQGPGMSPLPYEELAWADTPIGEISLRKRYDRLTERWVHEVRLGDEYLMSSQFNATEIALARIGLAEAPDRDLDVVVGQVLPDGDDRVGRAHTRQARQPLRA